MRWRWGLVAVVLGAACASLDGLSGGEDATPALDSGTPNIGTPPVVVVADSSLDSSEPDSGGSGSPVGFAEAGPTQTDSGAKAVPFCTSAGVTAPVLFCADFDEGSLTWTTKTSNQGSIELVDAATSPPLGVELQTNMGGFLSSVSLEQDIPSLPGRPSGALSFAFDLLLPLGMQTGTLDIATIGHHNTSGADFLYRLTLQGGLGRFNLTATTPEADGAVLTQPLLASAPQTLSGWVHIEIRFSSALVGSVPVSLLVGEQEQTATSTAENLLPSTPNLFIRIGPETTNAGGLGSPAQMVFDNVIVREL